MLLPAISAQTMRLECVRIEDRSQSHRWTSVPGTAIGEWLDKDAIEILDMVADLPRGDMMRCFLPVYGVRACGADDVLFEIAFCFECHNALLLGPKGRRELVGFNADSRRAQALLSRFQDFGRTLDEAN